MNRKKRMILIVLGGLLLLPAYFFWSNQNSKEMTFRQQLLKAFYPAFMWVTKLTGVNARFITHGPIVAPVSFDSLKAMQINGQSFDWSSLRGKKVLIVNTASDCGYTAQYAELQQLYERYGNQLIVLGFPSNEFKEQESGSAESISHFCQRNYGVTFPVMQKSSVSPGAQQHPVYQWLTKASANGWNDQAPSWNFSKYLIDQEGRLILYADPSVSPLDSRLLQLITD